MELILLILLFVFLIAVVVVGCNFLFSLITMSLFGGAYYAGTNPIRQKHVLTLARITKKDRCLDIGSGDGRLVLAAAQQGARAAGIEVNPHLVWKSRRLLRKANVQGRATIMRGDLWQHDLRPYSVITLYGISYMMERLAKKIKQECKPGTRVVSIFFKFPRWKVSKRLGECYLYIV